jgi:SM-20-related protein
MSFAAFTDHLLRRNWAVLEHFIDSRQTSRLSAEAQELWSRRQFRAASVGRDAVQAQQEEVRSDSTYWFSDDPMPAQRELLQFFDTLRTELNSQAYLGLIDVECHFARYGIGDFYAKHLDRFRSDDRRVVSAVLYLNEDWRAEDGGELKLFPRQEDAVLVRPQAGTLTLFMSEHVEHEVLPAKRERWSVAAWFRRRGLGVVP